jgi:hypothetical protein
VTLGRVLKEDGWEQTLLELKQDDVRGIPQSYFHDADRKKKKKRKTAPQPERPLSWIWLNKGQAEKWEPGDDVAMNEGTFFIQK